MKAIVACDNNWGIGYQGTIPWNIPQDLIRFSKITRKCINSAVIMGRKTYESLPKKPLKQRINIVLTKDPGYKAPGAIVLNSKEEVIDYLVENEINESFIIGGAEIYNLFMEYIDYIYLTFITERYKTDTTFSLDYKQFEIDKIEGHEGFVYINLKRK